MPDDLTALAEGLCQRARPDEVVEVLAMRQHETDIRVYDGAVESFTHSVTEGIGVRLVSGDRQGFAYAGTLEPSLLDEVLAEARDNAAFGTVDPHAGPARPDGHPYAGLDLARVGFDQVSTDAKIAAALDLEAALVASDPRITTVEAVDYSDVSAEAAIVNTHGVVAGSAETAAYLMAHAIASADGDAQAGFGFSVGRHLDDLDPDRVVADARDRATALLGATQPPTSRLTVVLDPFVTAQFLEIIGETLVGETVLKGRSPFADRVGDTVAAPWFTLSDDPTDAAAFTASVADAEGLATRRNELVVDGVLQGFLHDSTSGRRAGLASTGSAVRTGFRSPPSGGVQALTVVPGRAGPDELIAEVDDGLLVLEVSGLHSGVNPVSGDFSTGVSGRRIRGGELAEPVREATIASTLQRMLLDLVAVGDDLEHLPMSAVGVTLVIGDITLSGS